MSWWLVGSCHCMLLQGICPVTSFLWIICWMLLVQGQKYILRSQWTGPRSQSQFWDTGLVYFVVFWLCTSWYWRLAPCSYQSGSSIHYPQVGGMVLIWTLPHIFLSFLCLRVGWVSRSDRNKGKASNTKNNRGKKPRNKPSPYPKTETDF